VPLTGKQQKKALVALQNLLSCKERKDMVEKICLAGGGTMGPWLYLTKKGLQYGNPVYRPSDDASGPGSYGVDKTSVRPSLALVKEFDLEEYYLKEYLRDLKA